MKFFSIRTAGAVLFGVWALAYADSLPNAFHFDDDHVIERNLYIRRLSNIPLFFRDARTCSTLASNANYRPLVTTTLAIDYFVGNGLKPVVFHTTQLILFLIVGVLFFFVVRDILEQNGRASWHAWAALFATGLFCLHTGNTETGNYISVRSELLCALGVLGSFFIYLKSNTMRRFQVHLIPMFIGALAKTPSVIFGPLLFVYKITFEADLTLPALKTAAGRRKLGVAVVTSLPALIASALTFKFVEGMNPPGQSYGGGDKVQYLWTESTVWLRYIRLFFLPTGLSADNDQGLLPTWQNPLVYLGVATLILSLGLAAWTATKRDYRPVTLGIVWFWLGIAPTSTIFPLAELTNDHRMFLGWFGLTLAVTTVLFQWSKRLISLSPNPVGMRKLLMGLAVALLAAHAIGTAYRNTVWRTEEGLWRDVTEKSPGNGRGWMNYGLTQMSKGNYAEAKRAFDTAQPLVPTYSVLAINQGVLANATGDAAGAERHYRDALTLFPRSGAAPFFYGSYLIAHGRAPEGIPMMEQAETADWGDANPRHVLMTLYSALGKKDRTLEIARRTVSMAPDNEAQAYIDGHPPFAPAQDTAKGWFDLGLSYTSHGDHGRAAIAYRESLARDANYADAWLNLGWSLDALGFLEEAVPNFQKTLTLRPGDTLARNNLVDIAQRTAKRRPAATTARP